MDFKVALEVEDILKIADAEVLGDSPHPIMGINEIHKVRPGDLSYVDHPKYYKKMLESEASYILINEKLDPPAGKTLLYTKNPFAVYNAIVKEYFPWQGQKSMIAESATIDETAQIQPGVFIGPNVEIGAHTIIQSGVQIQADTIIGGHCIIHSGTVVGSDAFYYHRDGDAYTKMLSCGRVVIGDYVEIGALCTIDKGVSGETIIGTGTKIDNHVHIGHGVEIGRNCLIAAQVGIAGKTIIGDEVKLWGQVGVNKSLTIGDNAEVYAQSGVASSLEGNRKYFGSPAEEARSKMKELKWIKRIEEIWQKVNK